MGAVYWLQVFFEIIYSRLVATSVLADETLSQDPATASVSFLTSLYLHPWFSLSGTFDSIFLSIPIFTLLEKITSRHAHFILPLCNFLVEKNYSDCASSCHAAALPRGGAPPRHRHLDPRLSHQGGPLRLQHGLR